MEIKAVIFDLDGTLLNTLEDIADSMNHVLTEQGFQGHELDPYRYFIGDGLANLVRRALPGDARDPETIARCLDQVKKRYRDHWDNKTRPYEGIVDMLEELKKRGMFLAVLSNKDHEFTVEMVERYFPAGLFSEVAGAKSDVPLKPAPDAALTIISALSFQPSEGLFVGDTAVDIKTAVNAGLFPLGVSWGFRPVRELVDSGAGKVIDRPQELVDFLSGSSIQSL